MRAMGLTLLLTVALCVMLGIAQIWGNAFAPDIFLKLIVSLGLIGGVTCYGVMLVTELQQHKSKMPLLLTGVLSALSALLILVYMWTDALALPLLLKILGTLFLLAILAFFIFLQKEDFSQQKDLRDQGYLD